MKIAVGLTLAAIILAACQPRAAGETVSAAGGLYRNVSPQELNAMLRNKDFVFINVHIPFAGKISGTDWSVPYDQIEQHLNKLPTDKNAKIVLYCRSGHMSSLAAETLIRLGYTNVWSLKGGMAAWAQAGYPIESQ